MPLLAYLPCRFAKSKLDLTPFEPAGKNQNEIWAYGDNLYAQLGRGTRDTKAENFEAKKSSRYKKNLT